MNFQKAVDKNRNILISLICGLSISVTACNTNGENKTEAPRKKSAIELVEEADLLFLQEKNDKALILYGKALERKELKKHPAKYAEALAHKSRLLVMNGNYAKAKPLTEKCLEVWKNPSLVGDQRAEVLVCLDDLGQAYFEKARGAKEIENLEESRRILGEPFEYRNLQYYKTFPRLASAYLIKGDEEKAAKFKKLTLESEKNGSRDIIQIAVAYRIIGDNKEASRLLEIAQEKSPADRHRYNKILMELALARKYRFIKEPEKAEAVLKAILKRPDTSYNTEDLSDTYEELAYVYEKKGDISKATKYFEKSLREQKERGPRQKLLKRRLEGYYRFAKRNKLGKLSKEINIKIRQIINQDPESTKHIY